MIVQVLACTRINEYWMKDAGWVSYPEEDWDPVDAHAGGTHSDLLAEFAGRNCYQSWERPNPETADNKGYLRNILKQEHFSILEHASVTFYISDISRSLTHELVRHRHLSFSQMSQRYVDETLGGVVVPPAFAELEPEDETEFLKAAQDAIDLYAVLCHRLVQAGLGRKQAREAARSILPNAMGTNLVVSGNMRTWREVIMKRSSPAADAEMQLLAKELLTLLKILAPNTFQDLEVE